MSAKKSTPPKSSSGKASSSGKGYVNDLHWLNPSLNSTDVQWLEDRVEEFANLRDEFWDDLGDGERVTIKREDQSGRWQAILFAGVGDARNAGVALSVRGATPFDALCVLAYCHLVKYSREYGDVVPDVDSRWG